MCRKKAVWVLVYVASCGFPSSATPRIGTTAPQNPPVAPPRGISGGTMRTLCAGSPSKPHRRLGKSSQCRPGGTHPTSAHLR